MSSCSSWECLCPAGVRPSAAELHRDPQCPECPLSQPPLSKTDPDGAFTYITQLTAKLNCDKTETERNWKKTTWSQWIFINNIYGMIKKKFVSVVKECLDFSVFFCDPLLKYQVLNQANLVTSHLWIYVHIITCGFIWSTSTYDCICHMNKRKTCNIIFFLKMFGLFVQNNICLWQESW